MNKGVLENELIQCIAYLISQNKDPTKTYEGFKGLLDFVETKIKIAYKDGQMIMVKKHNKK